MGRINVSAANGIQESGGRQTHSRGRKPPVWGKENRSPEAPERTRRQRGPTESVALNMPCAHIRSRRSWLRAYALALICRPSASSAAPQALQGSISFSCVTGGSHLRLRLDEPPPATFCRPPDSQIRLAALAGWRRQIVICGSTTYEWGFTIFNVQYTIFGLGSYAAGYVNQ